MDDLPYIREILLKEEKTPDEAAYPFSIPAVRGIDTLEFSPTVTCFIGENGAGKSTILEGIAVALGFNAEGGTTNFRFASRNSHSTLHEFLRIRRSHLRPRDGYFLRAESLYNLATNIEELDAVAMPAPRIVDSYGGVSLHEQSHGESFLALLMHRFSGHGLYILDEPEAALSPMRQLAALRRIHDLVDSSSQFIIATHSPILMAYPGALIYLCDEHGLTPVRYEETEHVQVMGTFLRNPEGMIRELFRD